MPDYFFVLNDESMGNAVDSVSLHVSRGGGALIDRHAVIHFRTEIIDEGFDRCIPFHR